LSRDYAQDTKEKECKEIASNLISDANIAAYVSVTGTDTVKVSTDTVKVGSH
jgi:hypothetical protein